MIFVPMCSLFHFQLVWVLLFAVYIPVPSIKLNKAAERSSAFCSLRALVASGELELQTVSPVTDEEINNNPHWLPRSSAASTAKSQFCMLDHE